MARAQEAGADILDIRIRDLSATDLVAAIIAAAQTRSSHLISYANVHTLNLTVHDRRFKRILQQADLVYCDGMGVRLGAWILGQPLQHRNTPPDWIPELAAACAQAGLKLFLLGANPGVAELAGTRLRELAPDIQIVGMHHGYFDKGRSSAENDRVVQMINASQANILIVGFGMPAQEYWIDENRDQLAIAVFLPVGAMLDYLAGVVYRAPRWMTDNGFEWLARLIIEPRRLWWRYIIGNPLFLLRVLGQRVRTGRRHG